MPLFAKSFWCWLYNIPSKLRVATKKVRDGGITPPMIIVGVIAIGCSYASARWGTPLMRYLHLPDNMVENTAAELAGVLLEFGLLTLLFTAFLTSEARKSFRLRLKELKHQRDVTIVQAFAPLEVWSREACRVCDSDETHEISVLKSAVANFDSVDRRLEKINESAERLHDGHLQNTISEARKWLGSYSDLASEVLDDLSETQSEVDREDYLKNISSTDGTIKILLEDAEQVPPWIDRIYPYSGISATCSRLMAALNRCRA